MLELLGNLHALNPPSDLDILLKIAHLLSGTEANDSRITCCTLYRKRIFQSLD